MCYDIQHENITGGILMCLTILQVIRQCCVTLMINGNVSYKEHKPIQNEETVELQTHFHFSYPSIFLVGDYFASIGTRYAVPAILSRGSCCCVYFVDLVARGRG